MYKIDYAVTAPLIAVYIGLMSLIFVNMFIALLSSTFDQVQDKAEEFLFYQRAVEVLNAESTFVYHRIINFLWKLFCNKGNKKFIVEEVEYSRDESKTDDLIKDIQCEISDQKIILNEQVKILVNFELLNFLL
jgi:hypothetical protein